MCRLFLLILFLEEVIVISSVIAEELEVHYCVKVNESATCLCPHPIDKDNCYTLQHLIDSVNTTINSHPEANVTLHFMTGTHYVRFTERVNVVAPAQLIMEGLNVTAATVRAHRSCNSSDVDCGLFFEGQSHDEHIAIQINDLTFYGVSIKLSNASVNLHNCQQLDQTLLNINNSNVNFTGETIFANSHIFTIYAFYGNIVLLDDISFINNTAVGGGAIYLQISNLYIASGSTVVFNDNTALDHGGAIYLDASKIYIAPGATVTFANNAAYDKGGAMYFEPGITLNQILSQDDPHKCFYHPWSESSGSISVNATTYIEFINNSAGSVGDHIYGASLNACRTESDNRTYKLNIDSTSASSWVSLVASDPLRVCICQNNSDGKNVPQCNKASTYMQQSVYPGEIFNISVAVVGWDYEMAKTDGVVYPSIDSKTELDESAYPYESTQGKKCKDVTYTLDLPSSVNLSSLPDGNVTEMFLYLTTVNIDPSHELFKTLNQPCDGRYSETCFHYTPVIYNLTMNTSCPPGFYRRRVAQRCECLVKDSPPFGDCHIWNYSGYFTWERHAWADTTDDGGMIYAHYCPFNYCKKSQNLSDQKITLSLPDEARLQCADGRTGRLCGRCNHDDNFSLAIGSSQCIDCSSSKNKGLSLLVFFAIAGFLLVFFISAFNLTVTQGVINGLLFYVNILWAYQSEFFPAPRHVYDNHSFKEWFTDFEYLRVIIAWINLDFGINTCFTEGGRFDAVAKTLLQYLFPMYLWTIAGAIVFSARYSTKMTYLFGNRAVSVLATIFLLSSTNLFKNILDSLTPTLLTQVGPNMVNDTQWVWSLDGNIGYFHGLHILVFLAAAFFFIFLWLPYTLLLLLMQWIRRISHLRLLRWVPRLTPFHDAYFAPLKNKHHYWFGVLLVTRCILLVIHMATYTFSPRVNYVLLLVTTALLLMWGNYYRVYRHKYVQLFENFFLLHIVILGAVSLFVDDEDDKERQNLTNVVRASIIIVLFSFCLLVIWKSVMLIKACYGKHWKKRREYEYDSRDTETDAEAHLIKKGDRQSIYARYRDSILDTGSIELTNSNC